MTRRTAAVAASAALAALASIGACTSTDDTTSTADSTTTQSSAPTTSSTDEPTDLAHVPDGTNLEPGTYSMALLHDNGPTRAVVDLPEGYVGGGPVIDFDGGDMAFWGKVTQVDTDPCLGGEHVEAGTSVRDLTALLVAQRHMKASQPVAVTIGGYHGVYLELTAPADLDPCRDKNVTIFAAGGSWLQSDVPSGIFLQWILNVRGQRIAGGLRLLPDAANRAEAIGIVESAEFTMADQS